MSGLPLLGDAAAADGAWIRQVRQRHNQLSALVSQSGTTAERPAKPTNGQPYYDSTLKKPVWWNTEDGEWKDATGAPA